MTLATPLTLQPDTGFAFPGTVGTDIRRPRLGPNINMLIALLIVAVAPALFWTLVAAGVAWFLGQPLSTSALTAVAGSIATFLALVCSALISGRS